MSTAWDARLREHGYRITPQRQLVLEAVEHLEHGTPEEILAQVQATASGVNLSTVYRALEVLEEVGLITHTHLDHRAPTYHARTAHDHVHLVCTDCGTVRGIEAHAGEPFFRALREQHGFTVDVGHLALHGRCAACSAKAAVEQS